MSRADPHQARARELAGSHNLQTKSFAIELRVDGTLAKNEFRVQPVWDEAEAGHSMVTVRPASLTPTTTGTAPAPGRSRSRRPPTP